MEIKEVVEKESHYIGYKKVIASPPKPQKTTMAWWSLWGIYGLVPIWQG